MLLIKAKSNGSLCGPPVFYALVLKLTVGLELLTVILFSVLLPLQPMRRLEVQPQVVPRLYSIHSIHACWHACIAYNIIGRACSTMVSLTYWHGRSACALTGRTLYFMVSITCRCPKSRCEGRYRHTRVVCIAVWLLCFQRCACFTV